jgi:hypothetical protein
VESGFRRFLPAEVTEHFLSVAPVIERFASENSLLVERYRKGKPAWELRYARRDGGVGSITLSAREPTWHALDIVAVFWLDDWATRSRRLRSEKVAVYFWRDAPSSLEGQLREALERLDRWSIKDLGGPHGPFKDWPADEKEFAKSLTGLPVR